ncbi:MAG TPA: response regulator [Steroidobacteraceae bacterium]|nr:response regulator [Steroidobacteraceae bacterium]
MRILVVDDDPRILKSLRRMLEADGHSVTAAVGGQAGIDTFIAAAGRGEPFAIVLLDFGMPYVDGRKVAAAIKAASPLTPVVLVTGWGESLRGEDVHAMPVDRVLSKPADLEELRAVILELTTASRP